MWNRPELFQFLRNQRGTDLFAVVPFEIVLSLGLPITREQHQAAQHGLDDRIKAEVLPWLADRLLGPVREAYKKGLDRSAFRRWFIKEQKKQQFQSIHELITWVETFSVPDSLRGKLKRGADLPVASELLEQFDNFKDRARKAATKTNRFVALQREFPELSSSFLRRFEVGRFYHTRFAKEALADYYGLSSTKTIERALTRARQQARA